MIKLAFLYILNIFIIKDFVVKIKKSQRLTFKVKWTENDLDDRLKLHLKR
jgi:hypothetical protein